MEGRRVLVIGSSSTAIQRALENANAGNAVILLVQSPGIGGGRFESSNSHSQDDGFIYSLWEKVRNHKNIKILGHGTLDSVRKENNQFQVKIKQTSSWVHPEKCNDCKKCIKVCPVSLSDDYTEGLTFRTAIDSIDVKSKIYNIIQGRPFCEQTCPIHLDIRGYIGLIADGKFKESLDLIKERLPFPATIGRICSQPCETECNRGRIDEALSIRDLKRFVADYEIRRKNDEPIPKIDRNGRNVAIIGAGPAGLTCAHDLAGLGYGITIFEQYPVAGGMLAVGVPRYRLPREVLNKEIEDIRKLGVEIKTNIRIGADLSLNDLFKKRYEAIFIAVGAHESQKMKIKGEEADGVVPGLIFLRAFNLGKNSWVGNKVALIGGGNVALDAARTSLRLGAQDVVILYRRSRHEMPASNEEVDAALKEGIKIEYLVAPLEIITKNDKVAGLQCTRMKLGEADASGRRRPTPIEGSEFCLELDMIIPAIGQRPELSFLCQQDLIRIERGGAISADLYDCSTNREGIFAGGDCVTGPRVAIEAIAAGKRAAISINNYLMGK